MTSSWHGHKLDRKLVDENQGRGNKIFGFSLEEVSKQIGIKFIHQSPLLDPDLSHILPQIASMGASVSVCDVNNDGFEDLFVYKWGKPELFRNEQGKGFNNVTAKSGLPTWINANTAIWLDYNSDGLVDLFVGGYYPEEIDLWHLEKANILTESFEYAQNGGRNWLFENRGDGNFVDVDRDGYPELIVANDYGIDEFYYNEDGAGFVEKSAETAIGFSPKSGMNVSVGDTYNKGVLLQGNNHWVPKMGNDRIIYENLARQE